MKKFSDFLLVVSFEFPTKSNQVRNNLLHSCRTVTTILKVNLKRWINIDAHYMWFYRNKVRIKEMTTEMTTAMILRHDTGMGQKITLSIALISTKVITPNTAAEGAGTTNPGNRIIAYKRPGKADSLFRVAVGGHHSVMGMIIRPFPVSFITCYRITSK